MSKDPSKPQHFSKTNPNYNRPHEIWLKVRQAKFGQLVLKVLLNLIIYLIERVSIIG